MNGVVFLGDRKLERSSRSRHRACAAATCTTIAPQPDLFTPLDDYRRALAAEIAAIKATLRQDGADEIRIPGERAYRERARLSREGLEIDRRIYQALTQLAEGKRGA